MRDRRTGDEALGAALSALGRDLAVPTAPSLAPAVTSRLLAERATGVRRPFPRAAAWTRRRRLSLVVAGLLALLALAAASRLVIGAVEIRVQPGVSPTAGVPPVGPAVLGEAISLEDAAGAVGFVPGLPDGPSPDAAYIVRGPFGRDGVLLAWRPSDRYPALAGTDWGLLLLVLRSDEETVVKTAARLEDVRELTVNGERGSWITVPHPVAIETDRGVLELRSSGNVLIWQAGELTYRLETSLGRAEAIEVARTIP
jgi:hypothetical protein